MIAALILMIILCLICVPLAGIAGYVAWKSASAFIASEEQKEEYRRYIRTMTDQIQESSSIFRLELARRMSLDIPEVKEMNNQLQELERKMVSFREVLNKFLTEGD